MVVGDGVVAGAALVGGGVVAAGGAVLGAPAVGGGVVAGGAAVTVGACVVLVVPDAPLCRVSATNAMASARPATAVSAATSATGTRQFGVGTSRVRAAAPH